ncbi:MCE family protein [Angustibacter luteus]|uniref:MCE family protein n=1 Tax=Angustibacter luteus TaxID=658456 RepID=A0ABW1JGN1_9ACTN
MKRPRVSNLPDLPDLRGLDLRKVLAGVLVVGVLAAAAFVLWPSTPDRTITAHFTRAVGLYEGSQVRVLGVPVGTVERVRPQGEQVEVTLKVKGDVTIPADAQAAVLSPSLVSDRYVQLLPAYTGGAKLADHADIPIERTAVPVELDRVTQSLDDLSTALGPKGANADGSLSRLLATSADNLGGEGDKANEAVHQLSLALGTVSGSRGDLFSTVKNLQTFTSTLAANDPQVRRLNTDLASVADQLNGEKDDLGLALKNLAVALNEVSTFVADNRSVLTTDVADLTSVTGTIAADRNQLAELLDNAPVALSNLQNAYNPASGTLDVRDNADQLKHPDELLCGLINQQVSQATACQKALGPLLSPLIQSDPTLAGILGSGR